MNNIINQLSQIEEKTVAILDGAADRKKLLQQNMRQRRNSLTRS